jgi:hypothetical protein
MFEQHATAACARLGDLLVYALDQGRPISSAPIDVLCEDGQQLGHGVDYFSDRYDPG